jgi:uncharacterized OB-fold protein
MAQKYKVYDIRCGKCGQYVLTYHKYGAGKGDSAFVFAPDRRAGRFAGGA